MRGIANRKKNGSVSWADINKDAEHLLGGFDAVKASGFNTKSPEMRAKFLGMSMKEYLRYLWNNPQAGQSPYRMVEGIITPSGKDEMGNILYSYNKSRE